ncbi:alpha/beta hydrolase [Gluconobacter oxydans]|uniref:alpha/beta fold hydrolase n=1 Tax=Gluconobacter thailandicus TaxID=257438 RepID=UPI00029988B5|nr:alpha/beta hydrolase [Gluconobacter thailandicus]AFW01309.1 alpha/beta hydrolase fold protein [Gluconobacter oxydans H24]ANQ40086.1 alpha/beta hydrolase [Gluconobacter oxydans]
MPTKSVSSASVTTRDRSRHTKADESISSETRFLKVDGGHIAYDDTGGDGPLILAIPGMGDLRSEYRLLCPILQNAGYRVVTMDVRGFGETSAQWPDYSAHAVGRDALALIEHLQARSAVILGNSFAAGAALWAAHDAPMHVSKVVLLGPIVRDLKVSWFAMLTLQLGFAGPWRVWFWATYWDSLFPTHKPADQGRVKAAIMKNLREPGRMAALRTMIGLSKADTAALIPRSRVPALVVMGSRDPDFPDAEAEAQWLATQLNADSLMINGAGHYPHTEMPERVAPELLSFIARAHG